MNYVELNVTKAWRTKRYHLTQVERENRRVEQIAEANSAISKPVKVRKHKNNRKSL